MTAVAYFYKMNVSSQRICVGTVNQNYRPLVNWGTIQQRHPQLILVTQSTAIERWSVDEKAAQQKQCSWIDCWIVTVTLTGDSCSSAADKCVHERLQPLASFDKGWVSCRIRQDEVWQHSTAEGKKKNTVPTVQTLATSKQNRSHGDRKTACRVMVLDLLAFGLLLSIDF